MVRAREYYDIISAGYNELYGEEQLKKWGAVKEFVKGKVLDVGCGTGLVTQKIQDVVGLDISFGMIKNFKGKRVVGDAHALPFKNDCFNIVLSLTVLQDCENPLLVLKEMKRVGGRLIFSVLKKGKWSRERFERLVKDLSGRIIEGDKDWIFIESSS